MYVFQKGGQLESIDKNPESKTRTNNRLDPYVGLAKSVGGTSVRDLWYPFSWAVRVMIARFNLESFYITVLRINSGSK